MVFLKRWKTKWELTSLTFDELFNVVKEVIVKQLDELEKEEIKLVANFVIDYEADSVDIVAMLLYLEYIFKESSQALGMRIVVPTDQLGQIVLVEDLFEIIYEVLATNEGTKDATQKIVPNLEALEKRGKLGELYPKE